MKEGKVSPPMILKLKTLSPLHIGTGEDLLPLEYVVDGQYFYKVPQELFASFLDQQGDSAKRSFADWITARFEEIIDVEKGARMVRDYRQKRDYKQQLSFLNNQTNTLEFSDKELQKRSEYLAFLQKETPIRSKVERWQIDKKGLKGNVREAIKDGGSQPYLPGSSLKGALRTAIFYYWLQEHANPIWVEDKIRDQLKAIREKIKREGRNDRRREKGIARKASGRFASAIEHKAFFCESYRGRSRKDDELMDLMKLISFADAHLAPNADAHPLELIDIKIYLVERKPSRSRDKKVELKAVAQNQTSFAEAIPAQRELQTSLDFNIDFLLAWKKQFTDAKGFVQAGKDQVWKDIQKKVQQLFNLDISSLTPENKDEKKQEVLQHLLACLQNFCHAQLQRNEQWQEEFKTHDQQQYMSKDIHRGMAPIQQAEHLGGRLMHLGYGTGFLGTTALLYFLQGQETLQSVYTEVMEMFDLGNKPRNKGIYKPKLERFPKSRRMAASQRRIAPLGWLQVYLAGEEVQLSETAAEKFEDEASFTPKDTAPAAPIEAQYYYSKDDKISHKKTVELDAVVVKSGRPNQVEVYVKEGETKPKMPLNGYRNPIELGKIIVVKCDFSKRGKLVQLSFGGFKK